MDAEFELKPEDLWEFNKYHHLHSPVMRQSYYRQWFLFPIAWFILCMAIWYGVDRNRGTPLRTFLDLLPLFSGIPFWLVYFPFSYRRKLRKIVMGMIAEGQNRGLFSRHGVDVSDEGVTESTALTETKVKWSAVERCVTQADYLFIYMNAVAAIIVPKRAFANQLEFERFAGAVKEHFSNAGVAQRTH